MVRKRNPNLTPEQYQQIKQYREDGLSNSQTAAIMDRSITTIKSAHKRMRELEALEKTWTLESNA
jgi:DNA-directed RNA polymerase specialized sigma24 family protein